MKTRRLVGVIVVGGMSSVSIASAATRYVNVSNATPAAPYTNWAMAATAIQPAIDEAASGDEILVAPGIYYLTGSEVQIPGHKSLALRGTQSREAVIDAQSLSCGVSIGGSDSRFEGFTVRNGRNTSRGGGIVVSRACTVRDCWVSSNRAFGGGGLLVAGEATNARIENCTISDNVVEEKGGGVALYNNSFGCLDRCVIRNNAASNGGGGVWIQHSGSISNCWIADNRVTDTNGWGGGVLMDSGGQTGTGRLVNVVVSGNWAGEVGGGVYSSGPLGAVQPVINCTIVSNAAGRDGGGAFAYTTRFINDIIYFNTAPTNANLNAHDATVSCIVSNCCTTSNYFWPNITNAPAFVDAGAGDFRLATASFCIDAGTTNGAPRTDIDGNPRPRRGMPGMGSTNCDMGAYEYGFHFNRLRVISSVNTAQFQWDVQDLGRYRLDISTNAAADPDHPVWNTVLGYTNTGGLAPGQFSVYTATVTNPTPPMPSNAVFRLRVDRATFGKRQTR